MAACGSPCAAYRAGTVSTVKSPGCTCGSSSQVTGVDTFAPGRARTD